MDILITLISFVIDVLLLLKIISLKKDIRYITRQIKENKNELTNIKINGTDKDIENLAVEIDSLYYSNHENNLKLKKNEEQLRESISNMSHDLRTPLTSVRGYIQLLQKDCSEDDRKRYLSIIDRRTDNLNTLINCFYDLSRLQNGEYNFKLEYINVSQILCEIIADFYNDFTNRNITPRINIDEKAPQIIADKNSVIRIFSNLISNMMKYGDKFVDISLKSEGNCVKVQFSNDAPNLTEDDLEKIFDRFYTGNASRSDKSTGLGLYITKELVEKMNHNISAYIKNQNLIIEIKFNI